MLYFLVLFILLDMKAFLMKNLGILVVLLILNAFFIFAAWFGLWGYFQFTFVDGDGRTQEGFLLGVYSELQRHRKFGYNATLTFGLFSYRIDHWYEGVRVPGVSTVCLTHLFLLGLAVVDAIGLIYLIKSYHRKMNKRKENHVI